MLDERQSRVSKSGRKWEDYVETFLRRSFQSLERQCGNIIKDLGIIKFPANIQKREKVVSSICAKLPVLCEALFIQTPILHSQTSRKAFTQGTFGDADVVVYSKEIQVPIVVISCKLSLHGRLTESLFYSLYYRITRKFKYVLATPDKGAQSGKEWKSEWGTPDSPTKNRKLATIFLDGVYVKNVPEFMDKSFNPKIHGTAFGGIVRPLEELPSDILRWYDDIKFLKG